MSFFGELYLRSTLPLLSTEVTRREVEYLRLAFEELAVPGAVLDLGCGHGRHAAALTGLLSRTVVGLELDPLSLALSAGSFLAVRGDFFRLPFPDRSLAGAYAWYSTLFAFEDDRQLPLFREVARVLRPGGRLVLQTVPWERLAARPVSRFEGRLPDGSRLEEETSFDPLSGRDNSFRRLTGPDGRVLSAPHFIRYYPLPQMTQLLSQGGFEVAWVHGGVAGEPLSPTSVDLIIGAERADG